MAQSDQQLLASSNIYIAGIAVCCVTAITHLLNGDFVTALLTITIAGILLSHKIRYTSTAKKDREESQRWLKTSALILGAITLIGLGFNLENMKTWLYIVPILIFFCHDFKPALWYVGGFSIMAFILMDTRTAPFENLQLSLNYIFYLGISCSLVYLREIRRRQLEPLRRTDNLTMAATREHLDDDLAKEIQRSEREGSDLAAIALTVDEICVSKLSNKEQDTVTIELGKLLHNNLRLFDSYYLWDTHEFLIVLPHTSSAQAVKIANSLRVKVRKEISVKDENITISAGVSGLNVGDNGESLTQRAATALKDALHKGQNNTQLFRASDADDSEVDQS